MSRPLDATRTHGQRVLPNKFALALAAAFAQGPALLPAALPGIIGFAIAGRIA